MLLNGLSRREQALVQRQGHRAVVQLRSAWYDQRTWLYGLGSVMALLAFVLPTGFMHQYLTNAGSLSSLHVLGVMAAACGFAALHGAGAVYFFMHWNKRARTLDLLYAWTRPPSAASDE
jgi:hypothetical protein